MCSALFLPVVGVSRMKIERVAYKTHVEEIVAIRTEVFIREQNVPAALELDGLDSDALHVLAFEDDDAIGTGRILPDGHIGRIAVKRRYRGRGIGRRITQKLLDIARDLNRPEVWLSSQYHAREFYQELGFIEQGDRYEEAGIEHIKMTRKMTSKE
jgi:predicted GNAT family N-acyltransferase